MIEGVATTTPATTLYTYPVGRVVITDPKNRATTYEYSAFGDPNDARLVFVWDADNKVTRYGYDAFGNLTRVNGPNATGAIGFGAGADLGVRPPELSAERAAARERTDDLS